MPSKTYTAANMAVEKVLRIAERASTQHARVRHLAESYGLTLRKEMAWDREDYDPGEQGMVADTVEEAEAVTSLVRGSKPEDGVAPTHLAPEGGRHHLLVDVDSTTAEWVPSSTPGHHHLYVPLGLGVPWEDYKAWLEASAKIGLIEVGYKNASISRGCTTLRLPWVIKGEETECVAEGTAPPPRPDPWAGGDPF